MHLPLSAKANMKLFLLCLLAVGAFAAPSRRNVFPRFYTGIVGGTNAADGEFPYQISFQDTSYVVPFHFCGGSIYNNQWIITAAHCVAGENFDNPQQLRIVAGDLTHSSSGSTAQSPAVDKIVQHEAYSSRTLENDIALLRVADSLIFDSFVAPIALPAPGQDTTGDCVVTGWGATSEAGNAASILQKVTVPVVSDDECRADYSAIQITDSMICAGLPQGGVDSCQGDSGGPMACSGYLGGIVSWGTGCARPGKPGVYTEVSYFVDWVLANAV